MMGQDAAIGNKFQAFNDLPPARVEIVLAHDHSPGTTASYDSSRLVSPEHGLPAGTPFQRFTKVTRKAAQHVDQARLADRGDYMRVVGRRYIYQWKQLDLFRSQAAKPPYSVVTCTLRIVIGSSCRGDNADECARATCQFNRSQVGLCHLAAKFSAAF